MYSMFSIFFGRATSRRHPKFVFLMVQTAIPYNNSMGPYTTFNQSSCCFRLSVLLNCSGGIAVVLERSTNIFKSSYYITVNYEEGNGSPLQ